MLFILRKTLPSLLGTKSVVFTHIYIYIYIHISQRIQSPCQMMIGVYNHLLSKVFRFHYYSQKVIECLGYIYMYRSTSFFKGTFWSPQMEVTNHLLKRSSLTGPRSRGHDLKDPSMFLITDPPRWSKGRPLTHVANDLMIVWKSPSPDSWQQTKFLKENKSCIALKKCLRRQIAIAFLQNTCQVWKLLFFC